MTLNRYCTYELVVVSYRSRQPLSRLLDAVDGVPVVVVDNAAEVDGVSDLIEKHAAVRYIDAGSNIGFAAAANLGAAASQADIVIFVNPDCLPSLAVLKDLTRNLCEHPDVAACSPALCDDDGRYSRREEVGLPPSAGACCRLLADIFSCEEAASQSPQDMVKCSKWNGSRAPVSLCGDRRSLRSAALTSGTSSTTRTWPWVTASGEMACDRFSGATWLRSTSAAARQSCRPSHYGSCAQGHLVATSTTTTIRLLRCACVQLSALVLSSAPGSFPSWLPIVTAAVRCSPTFRASYVRNAPPHVPWRHCLQPLHTRRVAAEQADGTIVGKRCAPRSPMICPERRHDLCLNPPSCARLLTEGPRV